MFESLKGGCGIVTEVVQFFKNPVKSGHQDGGEHLLFVLEMIIKERFSGSSLLDNLNSGGSFIALFGKKAACNLYYFPFSLNIFSPGYGVDQLNAKIGLDLWYQIVEGLN